MMVLANLIAPTQGIVMTAFVPMGKNNGTAQLAPVKPLLALFPPLAPMTAYVAMVQKLGIIIRVLVRKQMYPLLAPMTAYVAMVQKLGIIIRVPAILYPPF
jgi:hypothetical protein